MSVDNRIVTVTEMRTGGLLDWFVQAATLGKISVIGKVPVRVYPSEHGNIPVMPLKPTEKFIQIVSGSTVVENPKQTNK